MSRARANGAERARPLAGQRDADWLWGELCEAARRLDVEVRVEPGMRGGACLLRGRCVAFVDAEASRTDRVAMLASALAALDEVDDIYLSPRVREEIERHRARADLPRLGRR